MPRKKEWREGEIAVTFKLTKIVEFQTPLMQEWLGAETPMLSSAEQYIFDNTYKKGIQKISTWSEEDLKMKYISPILELGGLLEDVGFASFFDKKLEANVENYQLSVKADFVVAKGFLDFMQRPFFHFQEYKPDRNPTGDSMAQLLEAFLIGQTQNDDNKPLYGCEVNGAMWKFVTMEGKNYCVSKSYDSIDKNDLLQIIGILRKFREILETRLLD